MHPHTWIAKETGFRVQTQGRTVDVRAGSQDSTTTAMDSAYTEFRACPKELGDTRPSQYTFVEDSASGC